MSGLGATGSTNLASGKYVFRVTAASGAGAWSEPGRAIALVVTPPWWATWWLRALAIALVAGFVMGVYASRVSSLKRRRRALEFEIAERKQLEERLRASHRRIEDLAGRLITAQESERTRIGRVARRCGTTHCVMVDWAEQRETEDWRETRRRGR